MNRDKNRRHLQLDHLDVAYNIIRYLAYQNLPSSVENSARYERKDGRGTETSVLCG